jgi:hypothetical protein
MQIKIGKDKLKIASETLISKVKERRAELKKEAIKIIISHQKPRWFWQKKQNWTSDEAENLLSLSWRRLIDIDNGVLFDSISGDQQNYKVFCQGAINLADSLIWACNNSEDGYIVLDSREIECFNGWGIEIKRECY